MKYNMFCNSLVGMSHIYNNISCQDKGKILFENGIYSIVVCDGCGSSKYSEKGATLISEELSRKIVKEFDELYDRSNIGRKKYINDFVYNTIYEYANNNGYLLSDLRSTYIYVAIKEDKILLGRCGDGGIIILYDNLECDVFVEEKSDFVNVTSYFDSNDVLSKMCAKAIDASNILGFLVFSDGVEEFLIDGQKISDQIHNIIYLNSLINREKVECELLDLLTFLRDRTDDDCTLAVLSLSQ